MSVTYNGRKVHVHGFKSGDQKYDNSIVLFIFAFKDRLLLSNIMRIAVFSRTRACGFHTDKRVDYHSKGTFVYNETKKDEILRAMNKSTDKSLIRNLENYATLQVAIFAGMSQKSVKGFGTFFYGPKLTSGLHYFEVMTREGASGLVGACSPRVDLKKMIGNKDGFGGVSFGFHEDGDCYCASTWCKRHSSMRTKHGQHRGVLIDMDNKIGMYVIDGIVQNRYRIELTSDEVFFAVGDYSTLHCYMIALPFEEMSKPVQAGKLVNECDDDKS